MSGAEWRREYLGEWSDLPAPTATYRLEGKFVAVEALSKEFKVATHHFSSQATDDDIAAIAARLGWSVELARSQDVENLVANLDSAPIDPLDVEYDGTSLRDLLTVDEARRREQDAGGMIPWRNVDPWTWTPAQHAAIAAHWSAHLRAKVSASAQADCEREARLSGWDPYGDD